MRNEFRGEQPPFNELHKAYQDARVVDQALELGLPVFPCRNTPGNEKTDKTPLTPNGFKDASADPNEIRKMFSQHPGCLIGVPSAAASGIDILDVDPRHGGKCLVCGPQGEAPTNPHPPHAPGRPAPAIPAYARVAEYHRQDSPRYRYKMRRRLLHMVAGNRAGISRLPARRAPRMALVAIAINDVKASAAAATI
jgi:hypothetical protein